jgi:hypothetical protein
MTHWVFSTQANANAAQQAATALLPHDTLVSGAMAPVEITTRWADIVTLTDGRLAFVAKPGMALPAGATALDDATVQGLLPLAQTVP